MLIRSVCDLLRVHVTGTPRATSKAHVTIVSCEDGTCFGLDDS
jgi:hypothetical protein